MNTAAKLIGEPYASKIAELAVELYKVAHAHALAQGIIIADTKFEFGLDPDYHGADRWGGIVLVDEVLTPDSSRFWPRDSYDVGRSQDSFDKQYLRDWLTSEGLVVKTANRTIVNAPGGKITVPDDVAQKTSEKYQEAYHRITGIKA